jgi:hypothetical protein
MTQDEPKSDAVGQSFPFDLGDPFVEQAWREVVKEEVASIQERIPPADKKLSGQQEAWHFPLIRGRRWARRFLTMALGLFVLAAWLRRPLIETPIALMCILGSAATGILILLEVLNASGWDVQTQWKRHDGTFYRTHKFVESVRGPFDVLSSLALVVAGLIAGFALLFVHIARAEPGAFNAPLSVFDGLYFSTVTFATVGFGDIVPTANLSRLAVMSEIGISFLTVAVVLAVAIAWTVGRASEVRAQHATTYAAATEQREELIRQAGFGLYDTDGRVKAKVASRAAALREAAEDLARPESTST